MTDTAAPTPTRKPTGRSPSYPSINLETAIRRTRELYERERQHPTSVDTIVRHWGYRGMSGPAAMAFAALKKFGLVLAEGKGSERRGRLTHLAVEIIANPDPAERANAIKHAALLPAIHREIWEKYDTNLPSDANLQWELVRKRGFTESGAEEFIRQYKQTVVFAQLDNSDHAPASTVDDADDDDPVVEDDQPARGLAYTGRIEQAGTRYPIPIFNGRNVVIEGEFPLSEEDWNQFMTVLNVMKPALVLRRDPDLDGRVWPTSLET